MGFEIKMDKTSRGFKIGEFKDRYGLPCSIQESSLATENALWLGIDDPQPKILAFHVNGGKPDGWVPYDIPEEVLLSTRMHLTEEMAEALIEKLQGWLDTGELT